MKRKSTSKTLKIFVLVFVILMALLSFFYLTRNSKELSVDTTPTNTTDNANQKIESAPQASAPETAEKKKGIPNMPILMYHHIRDFNDQSDTIGTNLSIDPKTFGDQLDQISSNGYTAINFNDISYGNIPTKPIILTFDDGYDNFYLYAYPELKKRNMKAVVYIIYNDIGKDGYMTEPLIKEIIQNSIEIGSHTLSHPDLSVSTNEKVNAELTQSKEKLEKTFGIKILSLCYPSGKVNDSVETSAKNIGYEFAVTTKNALTNFTNPLLLNRYRVNHDTNISAYLK